MSGAKAFAVPWLWLSLFALLVIGAGVSLLSGQVPLSLSTALQQADSMEALILWDIRLPRTLLCVLVGASLGLAGAAMQGLLRNPLAEPGLLGVTNGAALGAVLVLYYGLADATWWVLPLAAITGAFVVMAVVVTIAGAQASVLSLILAGVAMSALTGAMIAVALNLAPNLYALQEIVFWLMGSLANRSMDHVNFAWPFVLFGVLLLLSRTPFLSALSLGEDTAQSMGFQVVRERLWVLLGVAACVGACVAVSGSIGFIGLVVPHILRPWVQHRPGVLLPASALGGAVLLLLADIAVREFTAINELKLGVITSLFGGPFFLYLILANRRRWV